MKKIKEFFNNCKAFWQKTKWRKFWFRFLAAFLATLLVVGCAGWGVYAYFFSGLQIDKKLNKDDVGITKQDYHTDDLVNIAFFGVDSRTESMAGRSDSIVIVTLDSKKKEIRLSAIERDTYVEIEGRGKDKINHAYAFGGPQLAVKTLNQNFDLDITDYAVVNFERMVEVVDALGGIRMDVPQQYLAEANKLIRNAYAKEGKTPILIEKSGEQLLNGTQALIMARVRKSVGGTSVRAGMHEEILAACYARLKEKSLLDYPAIAKELLALVQTTLNVGDVTGIAMKAVVSGYTIRQDVFPLEEDWKPSGGSMINGVWYRTYKEEEGKQHLIDFVYKGILPENEES